MLICHIYIYVCMYIYIYIHIYIYPSLSLYIYIYNENNDKNTNDDNNTINKCPHHGTRHASSLYGPAGAKTAEEPQKLLSVGPWGLLSVKTVRKLTTTPKGNNFGRNIGCACSLGVRAKFWAAGLDATILHPKTPNTWRRIPLLTRERPPPGLSIPVALAVNMSTLICPPRAAREHGSHTRVLKATTDLICQN